MTHVAIILGLALALLLLVRRGLIHVDMSLPWLAAILVLGLLSTRPAFVEWVAGQLGILYPPIAVVFLTIFVILGLITVLLIGYTRIRHRQIQIVRSLAAMQLGAQEERLVPRTAAPSPRGPSRTPEVGQPS